MAGTTTTVGDDRAGALHDRLPVRVGHIGDQNVTRLNFVHLGNVVDDAHAAGTNALTDGTTFNQHSALLFQQVTLHDVGAAAALNGFWTGLNDIELAVVAVFGPLDVHRTTVVLLDNDGLLGQIHHFFLGQTEAAALSQINVDSLDRTTGLGFVAVDHLDRFAAQIATQNRRATGSQSGLVNIELVRVNRTLNHGFAQTVCAGDKHDVTETGFGIQGKHHTGSAGFGAHHALHTR